ncbi:MAG: hypothetical protein MUF47_06825 [Porphyrobacter sp.]|nr:hypothetical protein [Porphyrobacter sp.]
MTGRKLDMGAAWSSAMAMIGQNKDTVSAIVGLFYFLPYLAVGLLAPEAINPQPGDGGAGGSPDAAAQAAIDQLSAAYADSWPMLLAVVIAQFIGSLSLLALLGNPDSPTVGEALKRGLAAAPAYFLVQVLSVLLVSLAIGIPLGVIMAAAPGIVGMIGVIAAMVVAVYLFVKFSLLGPVVAIEQVRNPIAALQRSWRLTKGNSLRIAIFIFLLFLTIGIVSVLLSLVLGLVFALFSQGIADIGNAVVASLVNAVLGVIFVVVLAAVHQQLAGPSGAQLAATFE